MTAGRPLTREEFAEEIHRFRRTAFRLELQPQYLEPEETDMFAAFRRGEHVDPTEVYQGWYDTVADHVAHGRRVERVRVQRHPPTDYQRFERHLDRWNLAAGEKISYMTRDRAHQVGLLPAAGIDDWWLLDGVRLIVMKFDDEGHRIYNELVTAPEVVTQACAWRDLAVHHSAPATQGAPA
jgi:hypothetical protein